MTKERVGIAPDGNVAVWIVWTEIGEELLSALTSLSQGFLCPECSTPINLARPSGVIERVVETSNCVSVSDRCSSCQARIHFDATPGELRPLLRWPKVAVGAPLDMPNEILAQIARGAKL